MSRRKLHFKKLMRQAGKSEVDSFFPTTIVKDKRGQVCTKPMTQERKDKLSSLNTSKRR